MPQIRVSSEVTGTVWKIEVQAGESVAEDQTLLIIESMKMEIPVTAPRAGKVLQLLVDENEVVNDGQDVVVIE